MNNSPVKIIRMDRKTISPEDLPPEAWKVVFGETGDTPLQDYYSKVSWVFRAVDIRANAVKRMPFIIENASGKKIDESGQYENAVGFLPNPRSLFSLVEMALTVFGYAYLLKRPNLLGNKVYSLRYLLPTSVTPQWAKDERTQRITGLAGFKRTGMDEPLTPDQIIYFWKPDPFVEFGVPNSSPLLATSAEAGVVLNVNKFAALFFERGAIKATLLAMEGNPPPQEKERIKGLWGRLFKGIANAYGEMVINAKSLTPVVVGEGLEALADKNLTTEKREAIATGMGIPHSILFSGAANYAVSQQDEVNLANQTTIPECDFMAEALNEQLFVPAGYKLHFDPESLDIFQEDEEQRAASMSQFMDALDKAGSFEMAQAMFLIFGMDIPDEAMAFIEKHYAQKEERAEQMTERLSQGQNGNGQPPNNNGNGSASPRQNGNQPPPTNNNGNQQQDSEPEKRTDLDRWKTKALKALKAGKAANVGFESDEIPLALQGAIAGALEGAYNTDDVNRIFSDAWAGYP